MSYSKAHLFKENDQQTATLAKAIAHPARIAILRILTQYESVESRVLYRKLPLSAPTIHQHLDFLTNRKIVIVNTQPSKALYQVNWSSFESLQGILKSCLYEIRHLQSDDISA